MDQALLQELLSGQSGLGLMEALSGLQGPIVPMSGGQVGPFGFSPYAGQANLLGGGGGFSGGGEGFGAPSPGVGAGDPSLGAQIGLGALGGGGANFLGGGGGGGEEQFGGGQVASATGGTTGDILGAIKAALSVGKTLQQAFDLFGGGAPGSFAMSDTTRSAFEAQRAGERQDFSSFLGGGAATSPMLGQLGAGPLGGANVPWETFAGPGTTFSNTLSGGAGGFGGMSPDAWQAMTGGAAEGAGAAGSSLAALAPYLSALGIAGGLFGAGQGFLGGQNDPRQYASAAGGLAGAGLGTAALAGALAPAMASGIGAFIAPAVGALQTSVFRGPDEPHAAREAKEVREAGEVGGGLGTQLSFAMSPSEMYQMLTDAGSGATSYSRKNPILIDVGGQRMTDLGEAGFFSAISQNPNALNVSLQAGVNPGYLTDINEGIRRAILRQTALLGAREQYPSLGTALEGRLGEERHRAGAARLAHIEKFRGGHMLDEYGNIQYGAPTRAERPWDMPALAAPSGLPPVLAALFGELGPIAWEGQQAAPGPAGPVFNPWEYPMSSYNLGGP